MRTTKEIVAANIYNRAGTSGYVGGDGVTLLNSAHPTDDGTQSNILSTAADLSELALEDLTIQIMDSEDSRGLKISLSPRKLIIPTALTFKAERILGSLLQNNTANNAINALRARGTIPEGYAVNNYFTATDNWFLRTDAMNGMTLFNREETQFTEDNDFDTENAKYKAYMRFVPGWGDWRGLYGSLPS